MIWQIHDVTNGRELICQAEFDSEATGFYEWGQAVRRERIDAKLELHSEESPNFFVTKAGDDP